eukprot:8429399-Prorocentrum_lima.AAC.1
MTNNTPIQTIITQWRTPRLHILLLDPPHTHIGINSNNALFWTTQDYNNESHEQQAADTAEH